MRQNNTTLYVLAGILWALQTIFTLINAFTGEVETLAIIIGLGIAALEGICAYALFIGDTYKFHGSIKILSIIISVAVGIVLTQLIKILSYLPGIGFGLIILLLLLASVYWALVSVSEKADENEPLDKYWYIPGALYLISVVFSYMLVKSMENKYGLSLNVAGSLISDNLVTLIFGLAVFFITGYAFYDAQRGVGNNGPTPPQNTNIPMGGPDSSSVFGNLYSNGYQQQNMGGAPGNNMNPYNAAMNNAYNPTQNNAYGNFNNTVQNNAYGSNASDNVSETNNVENEKPSGSGMFTLKKD